MKALTFSAVAVLTALLSACTQTQLRMDPEFGDAITADIAAQIAYPDAHYSHDLQPGYDGARAALAQKRYQSNQVIQPSSITASSSSSVGNIDNGATTGTGNTSIGPPSTSQ